MPFQTVNNFPILVQGWRVTGTTSLAASVFLIFVIAFLYECLSSLHTYVSTRLKLLSETNNNVRSGEISMKIMRIKRYRKGQLCLSTFLYVTQMVLAFLIMLAVMTFQVWIIVTSTIAIGIGYHFAEPLISGGIDTAYRKYLEESTKLDCPAHPLTLQDEETNGTKLPMLDHEEPRSCTSSV